MLRCGTVLIMFGQAVKLIGFEGENTIEPGPAVYCRCPWYRFRGAAWPRVLTSWSVLAFARRASTPAAAPPRTRGRTSPGRRSRTCNMTLHDITWHYMTYHDITWRNRTCHDEPLGDIVDHGAGLVSGTQDLVVQGPRLSVNIILK